MKSYNVKTTVKKYGNTNEEVFEEVMILGDSDELDEFIQMTYGCWYNVISFEFDRIIVGISKTFIKEEAMKLIKENMLL